MLVALLAAWEIQEIMNTVFSKNLQFYIQRGNLLLDRYLRYGTSHNHPFNYSNIEIRYDAKDANKTSYIHKNN